MVRALAIVAAVLFLAAYVPTNIYLIGYFQGMTDTQMSNWFCALMAGAKTSISFSYYLHLTSREKELKAIVFAFFMFSLNELLDELFFNPYAFNVNELLILITVGWHLTSVFYERKF